jgi:uncharacterized damage-inducible protein DinB
MEEELLDAWRTHCRLNLFLLDAIPPESLSGVSASKGRSVGQILAHIHNNRLLWLENAGRDLVTALGKVEKEQATDKVVLRQSLEASGLAVEGLIKRSLEAGGKVKGFKGHAARFLGYLIAHDWYHHGEIGMTLTQSGHPLDKRVAYDIWDWRKPERAMCLDPSANCRRPSRG